ncbi:ice-binding family protein [Aquipuribacter sp. MA13-6]|uniref:ice-binding family protein n=1 Tax=unclassified Aquipuribacter TaxID=2635084 RepID=UPI003EEEAC93
MSSPGCTPERNHRLPAATAVVLAALMVTSLAGPAHAAPTTVELGTAEPFAVLSASGISDVPTSVIAGDVGTSPIEGSAITGLTCDGVDGDIYTVDDTGPECRVVDPGLLTTARNAQTAAYVDAAGRTPDTTYPDVDNQLGGKTLVAGVYRFGHAETANLTGTLTLDGDESSVWIFQATSDLVFASTATVALTGGAQACNVFWQVGSDAQLGTDSDLVGTFLVEAEIAAQTGATIEGRLMSSSAVTLDQNVITRPGCDALPDTPTGEPSDTPAPEDTTTPDDTEDEGDTDVPSSSSTTTASGPSASGGSGSGSGSGDAPQVRLVPVGAVAAGDGSAAAGGTSPTAQVLTLTGLLALLVAGAVGTVRAQRRA